MEAITVKELLAAVHGELLQGDETAQILGVNTDSRTVKAGEVFVPLVGERFDGLGRVVPCAVFYSLCAGDGQRRQDDNKGNDRLGTGREVPYAQDRGQL